MLILVVMLLFALLAIAGLLIDLGMARLTQAHMQSVSDAAAIEGGWQLAMGADEGTTRDAVVRRAAEMSESWGPHRIELEDGYDLNDDGKPESSQTIKRDTLGEPVRPMLDPNNDNDIAGDIVLGEYERSKVPDFLPGQPIGYDRSPAFEPNDEDPNSILVRLRRTGEEGIAGGTSAERLTYLWSRGSLLDLSLKGAGIAVRSETIAKLAPVVAIGDDAEGLLPTALDAAIPLSQVTAESYDRESLMDPVDPKQIGTVVENDEPTNPEGIGYLPIAKELSSGQWQVIGFMFAEVTATEVRPVSLDESGYQTANASASFLHVANLSDELIHENRTLTGEAIARAPVLVRSQQIQGGTP
ncbi:Tad domain-containing protein [Neorhodopirellula lusitana]|nr:Tad domain-containing protein [Neorhodopirellula lusitana]